jgi:hypothetical protein
MFLELLVKKINKANRFVTKLLSHFATSLSLWNFIFFFSSEILRVIDSLQLTAVKKVATPADWKVITFARVMSRLVDVPWGVSGAQ